MNILTGYTSEERPYEVKDYPYGFRLRTSIFYWIESKPGKGDRFCSYTINPKNGRKNAAKCSTYATFMYMYINDIGHVDHAEIDSYDREIFEARFEFIINKVGEVFITDTQKNNLRINHYNHVRANSPYELCKYSEEKKPEFKKWLFDTLTHIKNCEFKDLVNYPEKPVFDNPTGEVKMFITVREEKPEPEAPAHSITPEKVTDIIKNQLPGFYVSVSEHMQTFGGNYLKIVIAANNHNINGVEGQKVQTVSLSLDLRKLELNTQIYGGNGGGCIYRQPNKEDSKERFLAMKSVKVSFRRPACNEKDVLNAIERFAINYKKALIENKDFLMYQDIVNYDELLNNKSLSHAN